MKKNEVIEKIKLFENNNLKVWIQDVGNLTLVHIDDYFYYEEVAIILIEDDSMKIIVPSGVYAYKGIHYHNLKEGLEALETYMRDGKLVGPVWAEDLVS